MKLNQNMKWLAGIAGVIVVLIIVLLVKANVTSAGNRLETGLNAQYGDNQNFLSDCEVKSSQAVQSP